MTIDEINQQVEAEKRLAENIEKVGAKIADETALAPEDSSDQDVQMMDADYDAAPSAAPVPAKEPTQKCTVCGKLIPVSEIENHVRVELLDPKWREQRLAARAKGGDHTMASAEEMATNLRDFVRARKRPFAMPSQQTAEEKAVFGEKQAVLGEEKSAVQTSAMPAAVMPSVAASNSLVTVMAPAMSITSAPPVGIGMPPPQSHLGPGAGLIPQPPLFGIMQPLQQPPFNSFDAAGMMHPSQQPFLGSAAGQMPLQPPFGLDVGLMQPTLQPEMAMALPQPPLGRVAAVMSRGSMTTSEMTGMAEKNNLMPEEQYLRTHSENVVVIVKIPADEGKQEWNFNGQNLSLPMRLTNRISDVKTQLSKKLNQMPESKMKLKVMAGGFLKNELSLAYYNISSAVILELGVKARGRRK